MAAARLKMIGVLAVLGTLALPLAVPTEVGAQAPAVDPEATRLFQRMTDYLGSLDRFSLHTGNTIEDVLESGQKIQYDFVTSVVVQRPDKLRAERTGDLIDQVVVYDGKTLTIYEAGKSYYAVADAPDNIDDVLHFARDTLDLVPPSGDLIYTNSFELLTDPVTSGMVVGKSVIDGVMCDHLAFSGPVVDWQIWIADGDKPLPYKYVITTKDDPAQPQYILMMSDWSVEPKLKDALFKFKAPKDATKIDFLRMDDGQTSMH
jgi:hypothetical protein